LASGEGAVIGGHLLEAVMQFQQFSWRKDAPRPASWSPPAFYLVRKNNKKTVDYELFCVLCFVFHVQLWKDKSQGVGWQVFPKSQKRQSPE
jgi:hypothetical protein